MPSLLKYFTITGGALLGLLIVLNSVMAPGGPGPTLVKAEATKAAVKHDPQASKVERLRAQEAADKAAKAAAAAAAQAEAPVVVTEPPMPARPVQAAAPAPAQAAPAQAAPVHAAPVQAAPTQVSAPAALFGVPTEDEEAAARAKRLTQERKAEKAAAKARKARLARERARTRAVQEASAQHAPQHYGYAPRPMYGPFAQGGGWGGGWQGQRW